MRYVETIDARAVVPSAGPPAFLDPDMFGLNVIEGDEPSIFPDQRSFMARLDAAGHRGILADPRHRDRDHARRHRRAPPDARCRRRQAIFDDKRAYLERYQADWLPWLDERRPVGPAVDRPAGHAPGVVGAVAADGAHAAGRRRRELPVARRRPRPADRLPERRGPRTRGRAVRVPVRDRSASWSRRSWRRAVDWSNSLFLSCRFTAWREGDFNEYLYNFFKSLSVERMRRTEAEAVRKLDPPTETEPDIELGDYVVQRRCPHRNADLTVFGEIEAGEHGDELVCTLHGWRFDCATGRCRTAADHHLRIARRVDA
jgi:UDP-MurNAc hydroxylase